MTIYELSYFKTGFYQPFTFRCRQGELSKLNSAVGRIDKAKDASIGAVKVAENF